MGEVTGNFYHAASPECTPDSPLLKPAVAFEVHNSLSGIAGDYVFPDGMGASAYEQATNFLPRLMDYYQSPSEADFRIIQKEPPPDELINRMQEEWYKLEALNPALATLAFDRSAPFMLHDAIAGAACLLNTVDIDFFLDLRARSGRFDCMTLAEADPAYHARSCAIERLAYNNYTGWTPAPSTQRRILDQLAPNAKPPEP